MHTIVICIEKGDGQNAISYFNCRTFGRLKQPRIRGVFPPFQWQSSYQISFVADCPTGKRDTGYALAPGKFVLFKQRGHDGSVGKTCLDMAVSKIIAARQCALLKKKTGNGLWLHLAASHFIYTQAQCI